MDKTFVTLSLNPAIDRTMYFDKFVPGTLNRTCGETVCTVGSKGVNVARSVLAVGGMPLLLTFSGGDTGELLQREIYRERIAAVYVDTDCGIRENIKIIESDGRATEANDRGGPIKKEELDTMMSHLKTLARSGRVFILSGSLPQGADVDTYKKIIEMLNAKGCVTVLDCDGEALRKGLEAHPDMIKPNKSELEVLIGEKLGDIDSVAEAAERTALEYGCDVLCTVGKEGSVYASHDDGEVFIASAPDGIPVRGASGAGDTYLGVWCYRKFALHEDPMVAMVRAASAAAAKVASPGTTLPDRKELSKYERLIDVR